MVREGEVFIKDEAKVASRVSGSKWLGINFGKLLWETNKQKSSAGRERLDVKTIIRNSTESRQVWTQ